MKTVERATTIAEGNVKVQTVEHVLSALAGLGVDNAIIEMDANEPPIGDGSAAPYVELIKRAGIVAQEGQAPLFGVHEPVHLETKTGSLMTVVPDEKFRISCTQAGPDGRFTQFYSTEITPEIFEKEIAPARTFVFYEDVKPLMDKGLIKGGSLESAIVIRGESVLSKEPLRFPDEFARHKILDIVGDLALFGRRIKGHVIAVKPGHGPNTELARAHGEAIHEIDDAGAAGHRAEGRRGAGCERSDAHPAAPLSVPDGGPGRGIRGRHEMHRHQIGHDQRAVFPGTFPGASGDARRAAARGDGAGGQHRAAADGGQRRGQIGYFMSADEVKFRKPVMPGDTLFIHVEMLKFRGRIAKAIGRCVVNDEVVSEAQMMFGLIET